MKKSTCALVSALCFLTGVIVGFVFAPSKNGVSIGNNSGNYYDCNKKDIKDGNMPLRK